MCQFYFILIYGYFALQLYNCIEHSNRMVYILLILYIYIYIYIYIYSLNKLFNITKYSYLKICSQFFTFQFDALNFEKVLSFYIYVYGKCKIITFIKVIIFIYIYQLSIKQLHLRVSCKPSFTIFFFFYVSSPSSHHEIQFIFDYKE